MPFTSYAITFLKRGDGLLLVKPQTVCYLLLYTGTVYNETLMNVMFKKGKMLNLTTFTEPHEQQKK